MASEGVELATAYLHLVPSLDGAEQSIATQMNGVGASQGKKTGVAFAGAFTAALGAAAIGAAVVAGFAGVYKVGGIFDDVSDTIRVGTGASGEALKGLVDIAEDVATSIPTSYAAAGTAVADLNTRLGLSGETLTTVASQYLEAGRILGQEVDINTTTAAFSAFRIEGDDVIEGMDTLFRVSQATGVGMNELAAATQANAPALQNLGFGFEETVSLVGALDKAGINSTQTLSGMGRGLIQLAKDGEEPQAAFRRVVGEIDALIKSGNIAGAIDLAAGPFGRSANSIVGAIQSGTLALDDLVGSVGASSDTILGVAAETNDFAESWTIVKNNAIAALEPIGTALFSSVGSGMAHVAKLSQQLGPAISEGLSKAGALIGPIFERLGPIFEQLLPPLLELWQAFSPLSLIMQVLTPIVPMLANVFGQLASTLGGALGTALSGILSALAPVVEILTGQLSGILATLIPVIAEIAMMIASALGDALVQIAPLIADLAVALGGALGSALTALSPLISILAELFASVLAAVLPLLEPILGLVGAFLPLLPPIVTLVGKLLEPLIKLLVTLLEPILALISPLIDGLAGALGFVIDVLAQVIKWVIDGIAWFLNLVTGSEEASDQLNTVWSSIGAFFAGIWEGIVGFFRDGIANVMSFVGNLRNQVLDALKGAGQWLLDVGRNIVQGLIDGISSMVRTAVNTVINLGTSMLDGIKGVLGINSPSKVFYDEVGEPIVDGTQNAVVDGKRGLQKAIEDLVDIPDIDALAPIGAGLSMAQLSAAADTYASHAGAGTFIYHAAPNQSFDAAQDLWTAMERKAALSW